MSDFRPTDEQVAIEQYFNSPGYPNLKVVARAGSGKTSSSLFLTNSTHRKGIYLAFGKKNADEAKRKFPKDRVQVLTTHALAYRALNVREQWGWKLLAGSVVKWPTWKMVREFGIHAAMGISPQHIALAALNGVRRFMYSADAELSLAHCYDVAKGYRHFENETVSEWKARHPMAEEADVLEYRESKRTKKTVKRRQEKYENLLFGYAGTFWEAMISTAHPFPMEHDAYLKLYQLSKPKIAGISYLIMDECQDQNSCVMDIVLNQDCQVVLIGDPCQPTGTMVSVCVARANKPGNAADIIEVPIEQLRVGDKVVSYDITSSHIRKTGSTVIEVSSKPYDGEMICVTTTDGQFSRYTPNHRCVVRIADAFNKKHVVYLMKRGNDYRVGSCQAYHGKDNCLDGHRLGFIVRARQECADAAWILSTHDSADEARLAEHMVSFHYGIPMNLFVWSQGKIDERARFTDWLNQFWSSFGNNPNGFGYTLEECAGLCLADFKKDIHFPIWKADSGMLMLRRAIVVNACNLEDGMVVLTKGSDGYSRNRASLENGVKIKVSREHYKGLVWSLNVERDHTYVGDGIVTHNCQGIFGFRKARNVLDDLDAATFYLSLSFRFGQIIADVANAILSIVYPDLVPIRGNPAINSALGPVSFPYALIARSNAGIFDEAVRLAVAKTPFHVVGSLVEPVEMARSVYHLWRGDNHAVKHQTVKQFDDFDVLKSEAETDNELSRYVRLIEERQNEVLGLCDLLENAGGVKADKAAVTLSTCHKAKGLQFPFVRLSDDYHLKEVDGKVTGSVEETHILYVAATRAEYGLELNEIGERIMQ